MTTSMEVTVDGFVDERTRGTRDNLGLFVLVALSAHAVAFSAIHPAAREPAAPPPLEIDLAAPRTPPPAPEPPPPEPAAETPAPAKPPTPVLRAAAAKPLVEKPAAPAPAAHAGALLTAGTSSDANDPVSFVTDENGASYGSGVVARGGTAEHGTGPDRTPPKAPAAPPAPPGGGLTPESDLSQKPRLEDPDACRGYFPPGADSDSGLVSLRVVVHADGHVSQASILSEAPAGEGFGRAARACLLAQRFVPAQDRSGRATPTATAVRLRFVR